MKDILAILKGGSVSEKFNLIKIGLASPELILSRSYGEVKKPETINYRTFKAERDGLFCAKIFGPTKDYECLCGKYKRLKHRGVICEKCGVEVTLTKVRRTRMANINLATPVTHIWFLRSLPSKISLLLNMSLTNVERILYFERYIVLDPGVCLLEKHQILTEKEYIAALKEFGDEFIAKIGGEAILYLLKELDLNFEANVLSTEIRLSKSEIKTKQMLKRLKLIESFIKSGNKPEWMIITSLPVLPPDLRPLVPLDGGRFASSDLNDLYRRIINRNNRLKRLMDLDAPNVIIRNEKRMLQESVDALIDNGKKGKVINGANKRPLKSLADIIKGKQGRFRQNLLGKRVDYSGRSVIVVGPKLKLNQCGIPKTMALELFKPFLFCELRKRNVTATIKKSKKIVEKAGPEVWDILSEVATQYPVLLNRAPTLHRLGIQAFDPILIDEKAIKLHPLVCTAFNADFDGDQMAVHIPLTLESQLEARILMMSINNVLSPANGEPIIVPTQDMVLGIYYLSKIKNNSLNKNKYFKYMHHVEHAFENNFIDLHTPIFFKNGSNFIETTLGRLILKSTIDERLDFDLVNRIMTKREISNLMKQCFRKLGIKETVRLADKLKDLGFEYATKSGISIGIDDLTIPEEKYQIIKNSKISVEKIDDQYSSGLITKEERYNKIIDIWSKASESITSELMKNLATSSKEDGVVIEEFFNPIYMMAESGARGSIAQIRQLAGIRGLMVKTDGSIIETPITANFKEGLNILQYFISTHGARKGLADTALKTANSGYLTRRLVDVAQDVVITTHDCKTEDYIIIKPVIDGGNIIENLKDRVYGRTIQESVYDNNGLEIIKKGEIFSELNIDIIDKLNIEKIKIRSVIKCESPKGVCAKCYGSDLTTDKIIDIGEAVGVIAAQSIGEPGTQLTMRTFHIGGAASKDILKNCIQSKTDGTIKFENSNFIINEQSGNLICVSRSAKLLIFDKNNKEKEQHRLPYGAMVSLSEGAIVNNGDMIAQWDPHHYPVISEIEGYVKYVNLIENKTIKREVDEITGLTSLIVTELDATGEAFGVIKPMIKVIKDEKSSSHYLLPGTVVNVYDEQYVDVGEIIARTPKETLKTRDITGGLPKVADIFEARRPKDPAILAEVSGKIKFGKDTKGKKRIIITDENDKEHEILIPKWKSPSVFENEIVTKGEIIVEGQYNPHDILSLLGVDELTEYIKREVQDIYRMQGVKIDDKHIEVIIKQMLKKAIVSDPGDSKFLMEDQENISLLKKINIELKKENKNIISYKQVLLGITKASLTTDSFISAASFQETTKVLTEAAISGKKDMLVGLKENVIVGKLIPAGTGFCKRLE